MIIQLKNHFAFIRFTLSLFLCLCLPACTPKGQDSSGSLFKSSAQLNHYFKKAGFILERGNGQDYNLSGLNDESLATLKNAIYFIQHTEPLDESLLFYMKVGGSVLNDQKDRTEFIESFVLGEENQMQKYLLALSNLAKYQPEITEFSLSLSYTLPFLNQNESYHFLKSIQFIEQKNPQAPEFDISQIKHLSNDSLRSLANNLSKGEITTQYRQIKNVLFAYLERRQ